MTIGIIFCLLHHLNEWMLRRIVPQHYGGQWPQIANLVYQSSLDLLRNTNAAINIKCLYTRANHHVGVEFSCEPTCIKPKEKPIDKHMNHSSYPIPSVPRSSEPTVLNAIYTLTSIEPMCFWINPTHMGIGSPHNHHLMPPCDESLGKLIDTVRHPIPPRPRMIILEKNSHLLLYCFISSPHDYQIPARRSRI